jgi:hypothetical protein
LQRFGFNARDAFALFFIEHFQKIGGEQRDIIQAVA